MKDKNKDVATFMLNSLKKNLSETSWDCLTQMLKLYHLVIRHSGC